VWQATWLPTILARLGYAGATSAAYLALSTVLALPALGITLLLYTRWSTRWTLMTYALGGATALALLGLNLGAQAAGTVLVAAIALTFFFITAIGDAFPLYAAEAYPTAIRGARTGLISAAGKLGGVVGPLGREAGLAQAREARAELGVGRPRVRG
jgi:MFS transporter, putative metabolite:H+ symporter